MQGPLTSSNPAPPGPGRDGPAEGWREQRGLTPPPKGQLPPSGKTSPAWPDRILQELCLLTFPNIEMLANDSRNCKTVAGQAKRGPRAGVGGAPAPSEPARCAALCSPTHGRAVPPEGARGRPGGRDAGSAHLFTASHRQFEHRFCELQGRSVTLSQASHFSPGLSFIICKTKGSN